MEPVEFSLQVDDPSFQLTQRAFKLDGKKSVTRSGNYPFKWLDWWKPVVDRMMPYCTCEWLDIMQALQGALMIQEMERLQCAFVFFEKREVCDPDALGPKISYIRIFTTKTLQIPKEKVGTAYPPWSFPGFFPIFFPWLLAAFHSWGTHSCLLCGWSCSTGSAIDQCCQCLCSMGILEKWNGQRCLRLLSLLRVVEEICGWIMMDCRWHDWSEDETEILEMFNEYQ